MNAFHIRVPILMVMVVQLDPTEGEMIDEVTLASGGSDKT